MKLYNISNARSFMERVLDCTGRIYLIGSDGQAKDLKEMARYFISSGLADRMDGLREIQMVAEKPADAALLLNYVAGMKVRREIA